MQKIVVLRSVVACNKVWPFVKIFYHNFEVHTVFLQKRSHVQQPAIDFERIPNWIVEHCI